MFLKKTIGGTFLQMKFEAKQGNYLIGYSKRLPYLRMPSWLFVNRLGEKITFTNPFLITHSVKDQKMRKLLGETLSSTPTVLEYQHTGDFIFKRNNSLYNGEIFQALP